MLVDWDFSECGVTNACLKSVKMVICNYLYEYRCILWPHALGGSETLILDLKFCSAGNTYTITYTITINYYYKLLLYTIAIYYYYILLLYTITI